MSAPKELTHKLHLVYIKAAKLALSANTFKKSNKFILESCNWSSLSSLIQQTGLNYIHKIIYTGKPYTIYELFKYPNRISKNILPLENTNCKSTKNFFLYKTLSLYNILGNEIKTLHPIKFKFKLKKLMGYDGK